MSWFDGVRHRVNTLLRPAAFEAELKEEMRRHRELDAEHGDAASRRRNRFGNETWYLEETRSMTWLGRLDPIVQDARYAWRNVLRMPGFTAIVVLTLALGVGANAVMFSLLDRLYLSPPGGLSDAASLRRVWVEHFNTSDGVPFASQAINYPTFESMADAGADRDRIALYTPSEEMRLGTAAGAPRVHTSYASANLFDVLGTSLRQGRFFTTEEARLGAGADVVVISDDFRRAHFGADFDLASATLTLGRRTYAVIGVADAAFTGLELQPTDVWIPLGSMESPPWLDGPWWESPNMSWLRAVLRADGAAGFEERAAARVRQLNRTLWPASPDTQTNVYASSIIEARGPGKARQELLISTRLGGVAAIILLIACANVINLLLARAIQRRRENAVRLALGISRARLMRQVLAETLLLALLAAAGSLLVASWGGTALRTLLLPDIEWRAQVVQGRVAAFTLFVAIGAGLVSALIPAVQSARQEVTGALKAGTRQSGRQRSRLRSSLAALQAALCVVLLVGAVLFVRSLHAVQSLDIGYDADRIVFATIEFAVGETPPAPVRAATMERIAQQLGQRGGIESVALAHMMPMSGFSFTRFYTDTDSLASFRSEMPTLMVVTPSFFGTTGLDVLRGRVFGERAREIVVNETMAGVAWPGREAIGQCMYFDSRGGTCARVVGIVRNSRRDRIIEDAPSPQFFLPLGSPIAEEWPGTAILARSQARAARTARSELREALNAAFPGSVATAQTMSDYLEPQYRPWRLGATLFTGFGLLALLVALIGIYTTISYGVSQRTHEFGVRMALGARVTDVLRQVVGEGVRVVAVGVAVGTALALVAGRLATALLYGVQPHDGAALSSVALSVLAVAALAALVPAWRAARVDPLKTLREE